MPSTGVRSKWSSGNLIFYEAVSGNGNTVQFGEDGSGMDMVFRGATASSNMTWDNSADQLVFDAADIQLGDSDILKFGDATGGDVNITWNASLLQISPAADDTGSINIGNGTADIDFKLFLGAAADFIIGDVGNKALQIQGDVRLDFSSATVAAANTDGGLIKAGTSAARITEDTANMRFLNFNFDNGATSGDNRGMYLRLWLTGAGGGGEAARIFTTIENVAAGTAHGAHISLGVDTSGSITGLGVASRNTLHAGNAALTGGTYAATQSEIYADGASADISGATEYSFQRYVIAGDTAGMANVEDNAFLFTLEGGTIAAGNVMAANSGAAVSHTIRVKGIDGATYYLMVSDTP